MERRKFTREFKLEAVKLIKERGAGYARAEHDLGVHQTVLRNWERLCGRSAAFFPGHGSVEAGSCRDRAVEARVTKLDRGSQYTREPFQPLMADHGVTCPMSRSAMSGITLRWRATSRR